MNEEALKLTLSSSPHAHSPNSTRRIMLDVCIALLPALIGAIVFFGARALTLTALSVAGCVFFEWAYRRIMKKDNTTGDLSAVVTGILVAFVCPVTLPFWTILIGDFFAIVVVKQLFGGIGANIVNPALAARAFLFSWPLFMNTWVRSGVHVPAFSNPTTASLDGLTAATPMASLHVGAMPEASVLDLFLGRTGGSLGEVSAMLLLLGGIYLLVRRVISARIPLAYLGTVAVLAFLFPRGGAARLENGKFTTGVHCYVYDGQFDMPESGLHAEGIKLDVRFTDLLNCDTPAGQRISIGKLNAGSLKLDNIELRFIIIFVHKQGVFG